MSIATDDFIAGIIRERQAVQNEINYQTSHLDGLDDHERLERFQVIGTLRAQLGQYDRVLASQPAIHSQLSFIRDNV